MPRKLEKALTTRGVQTAKPGMWADGGNLYLQVSEAKNGGFNRSWVFRFGVPGPDGKTRYRDFGLGPLSTFSLAQARERARLLREKRYDGIDPIEERKAARAVVAPLKVPAFDEVAERWLDAHEAEWRSTYRRAQAQRLRDYASPVVGKLPVRDVTVEHVTAILDKVWSRHPNTAALLRAQLEQVLDFAKIKGHREGENPARWEGHLRHVFGKTAKLRVAKRKATGKEEHHAALAYKEIAAFMGGLRAMPDSVETAAMEFTILTAARTGEVVGAAWDEIDFDEAAWTIPGLRMKAGKEHRVPLSDPAAAVLRRMAAIRVDDKAFPGLLPQSMLRTLQRMRAGLTVHGFRSSFRTWAGNETSFPREICEAALAHVVGGVEGAYARGDLFEKRRKLMDAWAAFCGKARGGATAADAAAEPQEAKVVTFHRGKRGLRG